MTITEQLREGLKGIKSSLKPKDTGVAKRLSPSDNDLERIFNNIEHYHCKNRYRRIFEKSLITLLLKTGVRINEAYNIHLDDINLEERTLFIRQPKGGIQKQRTIGLSRSACIAIEEYLEERRLLV